VAEAVRKGYAVLQSGRGYGARADGGHAYLDTESTLGMILEVIGVPQERVAPEAVFPPR
jgi:hypothetical protein